jgi:hypothetical protein
MFARSRGYWRGRVALGDHRDVPLLLVGGRRGPDDAALALARDLPNHYRSLQAEIGMALFEHYVPYREAVDVGEIEEQTVQLRSAVEVWPHVTPIHVIIDPSNARFTIEIGYRAIWDVEHTLGARLVGWRLLELNGSV